MNAFIHMYLVCCLCVCVCAAILYQAKEPEAVAGVLPDCALVSVAVCVRVLPDCTRPRSCWTT